MPDLEQKITPADIGTIHSLLTGAHCILQVTLVPPYRCYQIPGVITWIKILTGNKNSLRSSIALPAKVAPKHPLAASIINIRKSEHITVCVAIHRCFIPGRNMIRVAAGPAIGRHSATPPSRMFPITVVAWLAPKLAVHNVVRIWAMCLKMGHRLPVYAIALTRFRFLFLRMTISFLRQSEILHTRFTSGVLQAKSV